MNEIMTFIFPNGDHGLGVHTVLINGEPWLLAGPACEILGLRNVSQAVARIPAEHKRTINITEKDANRRGNRKRLVVRVPNGLTRLVAQSRKPDAVRFQDFMHDELVPALIRGDMSALRRFAGSGGYRKPPATLSPKLRRVYDAAIGFVAIGRDLDEDTADDIAKELGTTRPTLDRYLMQLDADGFLSISIDAKSIAAARETQRHLTELRRVAEKARRQD